MIIGLNTLFLIPGKVGGTETYTRGLLSGIAQIDKKNKYLIFCNKENYPTFCFANKLFLKVSSPLEASSRAARIVWEQLILPMQLYFKKVDVLVSLGYICPLFVPCKSVVVIFDLNWFFHPEEFSFLSRFFWKTLVTFSAKRADAVITSSESSKKDIVKVLNIPESKVSVVYGGTEDHKNLLLDKGQKTKIKSSYGIKHKFIFTVSAAYKFKNLARLIDAFYLVAKENSEIQLLIVGLGGRGKFDILSRVKKYKLEKQIITPGWIPNEDLPSLYSSAEFCVHPSLYEGFGFPVLEAMSYGCPVISSQSASLPEIVKGAGILVNAYKPKEMADEMERLIGDPKLRLSLSKKGFERCADFSWVNSAIKVKHVLRSCLDKDL